MEFCSVFNTRTGRTLANFARLATDPEDMRIGLLNHSSLQPGEGLLILTPSIHTVGMTFTIDVVFIGGCDCAGSRVLRCGTISPGRQFICPGAQAALELPGGTVQATQTREGDVLSLDYF